MRAWVCGGAERVRVPAEGPVAVDVAAEAGGVAWARLPVFAPETLDLLAVDEACVALVGEMLRGWGSGVRTVGVDKGDDVEVVRVEERFREGVTALVAGDELRGNILYDLESLY